MSESLERRIGQAGGVVLFLVVGVAVAELLGVIRVFTLTDFLVVFVGLGLSLSILRWWAS